MCRSCQPLLQPGLSRHHHQRNCPRGGRSEATVFRHFATKEELYAAILDHKACAGGESFEPEKMAKEAILRKDDRAVFESLALGALTHHEHDPDFQRLLLHSALEKHELAQMLLDQFVRRVYEFLGGYIRRASARRRVYRDRSGYRRALFHRHGDAPHSLNNNLWDPDRRLKNISNEEAARHFTNILLNGITSPSFKQQGVRPVWRNG